MRAGVKDRLGGDLKPTLDGPTKLLLPFEPLERNRHPRTKVPDRLVDLEKPAADDLRPNRHVGPPPVPGDRGLDLPQVRRIEVAKHRTGLEASPLRVVATDQTPSRGDDLSGEQGGRGRQVHEVDRPADGGLEGLGQLIQRGRSGIPREEDRHVGVAGTPGEASGERPEDVRETHVGATVEDAAKRFDLHR